MVPGDHRLAHAPSHARRNVFLSRANLQPLRPHDEEVHLQEHASELSRLLVFQPAFVELYRIVIALVGLVEAPKGP